MSGDAVTLAINTRQSTVCRNITKYCPLDVTGSPPVVILPPLVTPLPPTCLSCTASTPPWGLNANDICRGDSQRETRTITTCEAHPRCEVRTPDERTVLGLKGTSRATCTGTYNAAPLCTCTTPPPPCATGTEQQLCDSFTAAEWRTSPPHCACTTLGNYQWTQRTDGCYDCPCETMNCPLGKTFDSGSDCGCKCDDTKQDEQCTNQAHTWDSVSNKCNCGSIHRWQKNATTGCYSCKCKTAEEQCTDRAEGWDGTNCSNCTGGNRWTQTGVCVRSCHCPLTSCPGQVLDTTNCECVPRAPSCDTATKCCDVTNNVAKTKPAGLDCDLWSGVWNGDNTSCCSNMATKQISTYYA